MQLGKYKHYKWSIYEVIGVAKHSETLEDMVVYKHYDPAATTGAGAVKWEKEMTLRVRPLKMFEEKVIVDGKEIERFEYI